MNTNKVNIFLLITSVLSTLILAVGATFSYFTATSMSDVDAVSLSAADVKINFSVSELYTGYALIPLKDDLIDKAYDKRCIDDLGRGACLAYSLDLFNFSKEKELIGTIDFAIEEIENLSYMVLNEDGSKYLDITHVDSTSSFGLSLGDSFTISDGRLVDTGETKKFILLIWLTDNGEIQNETDGSGHFEAAITFSSTYGSKVTASVAGIESQLATTSLIE